MDERILQDVIYVSSGSDSGISSSKPTTSLWASGKKRRVSSDQESPRKRLRKAKEPIEEVPEARGSKRKATDMVVDTDSSFSIDDSAITSVKDASGAVIVIESSDSDTKPVMASKKRARTEEPDASISSSRNNNSSSSSSSSSTSTSNSSSRSNNSRSNSSNNSSSRGNNNSSSRKANTVSVEDTKVLPGSFGDSTTSTPTNSQRGGNDEGLVGTVQATSEEAEEDGSVLPGSFGDSTTSTPTNSQRGGNGEGLVGTVQETSEEAEEDGSVDGFEDKYEQLQQLGKGGFGCVYAGTRKADGLPVAIKRIRTLVKRQSMSIMKQLVDAAIDMHSKGILHRDIKLSNLLIETGSAQPRVRVIDFGCGCILSRKPYSTFSGTRAYTPPEYFTKLKYRAGPTTVWQLGSVLYEILDGARNFNTLKFCCVGVSIGSRFSKDCHDFLRACLMTNPEKRATLEQLHQHPWLIHISDVSLVPSASPPLHVTSVASGQQQQFDLPVPTPLAPSTPQ
ncbi:hypothetical protein INR49_002580, partial [Caranx melampygus]